jgi:N6-L-threonylcarbamoyladenine synthase
MNGLILAIETSCDDTCVAVITDGGEIRANVISSQGVHDRFGGVVPEIASRQHLTLLQPVLEEALSTASTTLDEIGLVAATRGPGLVAALLVGFSAAKALAAARQLPFAPVDHLHGHLAASFLQGDGAGWRGQFEPPFLALVASGGHTLLADVRQPEWTAGSIRIIGQTLDDAAGEAFDKGARLLGLGYPGGAALERLAAAGDPLAFEFPTGARMGGLDFSFAGLKTALLYKVRELGPERTQERRADLAAAYQAAIVEALLIRVRRAIKATRATRLALGGGVAANGPLRAAVAELGVEVDVPPRALCTDNAAMIASAARFTPAMPFPDYLSLDVYATGEPSALAA